MPVFTRRLGLPLVAVMILSISWRAATPASARSSAQSPGSITATAAMRAPRAVHTVTTLPDGKVLVAGGFTAEGSANASAELFDPATGRFAALPRMVSLRHSHTATLLPDGKVLIAGGYTAGTTYSASAELYDPVSRTFSATGSLRSARAGHIAIPLANGKVLIAGGVGTGWTFLSSAELYDPATGTFTPTGAMTLARESHAAVMLNDGRVLIVGGHRDRRANIVLYTSAEAYDPVTGRFSHVADMNVRRHKHDAVLLNDGRVLVTGGSDERDSRGAYHSSELFDPKLNTFEMGPRMRLSRYKHQGSSVLLPGGKVLIGGGAALAEIYDPVKRSFELVPSKVQMAGQFPAVTAISGGRALITGGYGEGTGPRATAWLYQP